MVLLDYPTLFRAARCGLPEVDYRAKTVEVLSIETQRLTLVPCAPAHLVALIDHPDRFEHVVGLRLAEGLRAYLVSDDVDPGWLATVREGSEADPWLYGFFVVHRENRTVVGSAGFKGPPDANGSVEIAYGIAPQFQGQGYATEAAMALVTFARDRGQARLVVAHTPPLANASTRVLEKCQFVCVGSVLDPHDGTVWRWERESASIRP